MCQLPLSRPGSGPWRNSKSNSQHRSPDHCSVASWASRQRALETEALETKAPVGTIGIVVVDEVGEVGMEVSFVVDDDDVVEHLRA